MNEYLLYIFCKLMLLIYLIKVSDGIPEIQSKSQIEALPNMSLDNNQTHYMTLSNGLSRNSRNLLLLKKSRKSIQVDSAGKDIQ